LDSVVIFQDPDTETYRVGNVSMSRVLKNQHALDVDLKLTMP